MVVKCFVLVPCGTNTKHHVRECGNALSAALLNNERVDTMYCLEVRQDYELIYKLTTFELEDIIEEVKDWCTDTRACYEVKIYEVPRLIVEVNDE